MVIFASFFFLLDAKNGGRTPTRVRTIRESTFQNIKEKKHSKKTSINIHTLYANVYMCVPTLCVRAFLSGNSESIDSARTLNAHFLYFSERCNIMCTIQ